MKASGFANYMLWPGQEEANRKEDGGYNQKVMHQLTIELQIGPLLPTNHLIPEESERYNAGEEHRAACLNKRSRAPIQAPENACPKGARYDGVNYADRLVGSPELGRCVKRSGGHEREPQKKNYPRHDPCKLHGEYPFFESG